MIATHDYGKPSIIIIQPFMISFLEDDSHLFVENNVRDQSSRHPKPTLSFGTILETRRCMLPTVQLTRPYDVEDIQRHGRLESRMVWGDHRLKHTKTWLRIRLVDHFLRHALRRDLSYEIQKML